MKPSEILTREEPKMMKATDLERVTDLLQQHANAAKAYSAARNGRADFYLKVIAGTEVEYLSSVQIDEFATQYLRDRLTVLEDDLAGLGVEVESALAKAEAQQ